MKQIRLTSQRLQIVKYLKSTKTHPNAEKVYAEVKKDLPAITLATVYRNLNRLHEAGDIQRLEINGEYHFDADITPHEHLVCVGCKRILDFDKDLIVKDFKKQVLSKTGFEISACQIVFKGLCKDCRKMLKDA